MSFNNSTFSNLNGVTFGSSGSVITASVKTDYLTTQTAFQFSNSNNVSFGTNGSTVTASASYPAQTAFVFSNSNGVSFGTNGSTVTATVATNYQSQGAYLTTAALSQDSSKYAGINGAITGGSLTVNTSGVSINLPAYLTTAQPVGAYLTTARASNDAIGLNSALTANGVSMTANSSGLSLNFPAFLTTAQPVGDYLTTAALSNHSHGNPTLNLTNLSGTTASNSAGFTLSLSANAPGAGGGVNIAGGGVTQGTGTVNFSNANGITFGLSNNGTMTASHNGLTTARASNDAIGLNTALTANGVSWTVNSSGLSLNVPAFLTTAQPVGAYLTTARASNDAIGLNTAGTNVTWTVNSSGLSFNGAGYAGTGTSATNASITLNSNGLAISVAAPGGGATPAASASNGSFTFSTLNFSNANNVTFGTSAGGIITASVAAPGGGADKTASFWEVNEGIQSTAALWNNATYSNRAMFFPFQIEKAITALSSIRIYASRTGGTSAAATLFAGIYTIANSTSMNLVSSTSFNVSMTTSAQFSGIRGFNFTGLGAMSLSPGQYVLGLQASMPATASWGMNLIGHNSLALAGWILPGTNSTAATASGSRLLPFAGVFNATSAALPSAVGTASISGGNGANSPKPYFAFLAI